MALADQIIALRSAIASGALIVKHGDTSTTYRSLKEMREILADLEGQQNTADGRTRNRVNYVKQPCKGL